MKKYLIFFISLIILLCYGCKESPKSFSQTTIHNELSISSNDSIPYITLPIARINQLIDSLEINDLENIAKIYYTPEMSIEGRESYTIFPEKGKQPYKVTIIHDNLADDAIRGIKFTLLVNDNFDITEIRQSFRCWPGRGRGYWHGGKCY